MKKLLFSLIIPLAIFQYGAFHPVSAQVNAKSFQVAKREIGIKEFNTKMDEIIDKAEIPGLSLAVINQNEVVFYNTYGYKKYERVRGRIKSKGRVNKRTLFEACSLSKSFFAFAVHRLVSQGVLRLDTPLYQYLEYPRLEHDERYKKITGYMILTHSSGIENWQRDNNPDALEIVEEPGEAYIYSGEGYVYLSKVVEKLLGKSTERYMEELVYQPLNLKRTFTSYKSARAPRNYSVGHNAFKASQPKDKNKSPNIAGMISTTAQDYAKLLIGVFGGKHLSNERLEYLTGTGIYIGEDPAGNVHRYGPGFSIFEDQIQDTIVYQYGDNTYFKGFACYNLTRDAGFVLFANGIRGDRIKGILYELLFDHQEYDPTEYPNAVFALLDVYNEQGHTAASNHFRDLVKENALSQHEFLDLSELFLDEDPTFSSRVSGEMKNQFRDDPQAYLLHGKALMKNNNYQEALVNFDKALELDGNPSSYTEELIAQCRKQLGKEDTTHKE